MQQNAHPEASFALPVKLTQCFIQGDQASEAQSVSQSINQQAAEALQQKRLSPLRAVLGAYVLVRFNQRDDMDDWMGKEIILFPTMRPE